MQDFIQLSQIKFDLLSYNYGLMIIFILIMLATFSITDYLEYRIYDKHLALYLLAYSLVSILNYHKFVYSVLGLLFGFILFLIVGLIQNQPMGGDIKLMGLLGLVIGPYLLFLVIVISIILSFMLYVVYLRFQEKKYFPYAPIVFISFFIIIIIFIAI